MLTEVLGVPFTSHAIDRLHSQKLIHVAQLYQVRPSKAKQCGVTVTTVNIVTVPVIVAVTAQLFAAAIQSLGPMLDSMLDSTITAPAMVAANTSHHERMVG